jgi:hypothetical protein
MDFFKAKLVIDSCSTIEQLTSAENYINLWVNKYPEYVFDKMNLFSFLSLKKNTVKNKWNL